MPTPALRELQEEFFAAITDDPGKSAATTIFLDTIEARPALDAGERLQVYVDAYFWRLLLVLRENFPRLAARLSEAQFHDLVGDYLRVHPSRHPSISYVGASFAEFLRHTDVAPFLVDLVRLEWMHALVFESPDAIAISREALRAVAPDAWPQLRFRTLPGMELLELDYPVHQLWRDEAASVDSPQPTRLRLWRTADYTVMHSVLDERESTALGSMIQGDDFATICQAFADLPEEQAAQESIGVLIRWLDDGIITGIETRREPAATF